MENALQTIHDKEGELRDLYTRMDRDRDIVYLNTYTLTGVGQFKDKELPNTQSVTMNDPAVFFNAIASVLQGSKKQTTVKGLSDTANHTVETFIDDLLYTNEARRLMKRRGTLWGTQCKRVAIRGPIATRMSFDAQGNPICLPVDMRWCPFEDGGNEKDFEWIANHTFRNEAKIKSEYGIDVTGKVNAREVYDRWDQKVNEIWIADEMVKSRKNPWGFPPFVISYPDVGFGIEDQGYMVHEAESIFFLVRDLIPMWNQLMSIQQTKALELIRPPYKHAVKELNADSQVYPIKVGSNMEYLEGEEPTLLETPDINNSFVGAEQQMSQAIHKGSPSISDLSETGGERNAQWITEQTEIRDKILLPRLDCLAVHYQHLAIMSIKEYRILLESGRDLVPLGRNEAKRNYTLKDLPDPSEYTIEFKYVPDNPRQKLANYSVGLSLWGRLPKKNIIGDIFQEDDPDGILDELSAEEAAQSNPVIFYLDRAERLLDLADKKTGDEKKRLLIRAKVMADSMVEEIKKQKLARMGPIAPTAPGTQGLQLPKGNSQALLAMPSLMGGGSGGGARQPQMGVTNAR
jgi:hypothetical protein